MWVPDAEKKIQLSVLITDHCGVGGSRGSDTTADILRQQFTWFTLDADEKAFVQDCIHCLMAKTGEKILRPLAETLHVTVLSQVVHFD